MSQPSQAFLRLLENYNVAYERFLANSANVPTSVYWINLSVAKAALHDYVTGLEAQVNPVYIDEMELPTPEQAAQIMATFAVQISGLMECRYCGAQNHGVFHHDSDCLVVKAERLLLAE